MATNEPFPETRGQPIEIRISRGATVMGTDGVALGAVHQIIMDQRSGELQALVLATDDGLRLELPASHVLRVTEGTVYVDVSQVDLRQRPEIAPPYNPSRYTPVRANPSSPPSEPLGNRGNPPLSEHPVVTNVERDAIGVVVPGAPGASSASSASGPLPPPPDATATTSAIPEQPPEPENVADVDESVAVPDAAAATGLEIAAHDTGIDVQYEGKEEATTMEGRDIPVNPANPSMTSDMIHDETEIADVLDESQHAYTRVAPPEAGQREWESERLLSRSSEAGRSQLSWVPAAALGALIVGLAAWTTLRAIRRGRRRAAKAARKARANVRESVRDAGKSAVTLAQTMRASAQEMAANPRDTASDALSNLSDIPARYRWFRRGLRVGAQAARFQRK